MYQISCALILETGVRESIELVYEDILCPKKGMLCVLGEIQYNCFAPTHTLDTLRLSPDLENVIQLLTAF